VTDTTTSSIHIEVPRADILAVIADFATYPDWADGIKSADVLTRHDDGSPATVRFTVANGPYSDTYVLRYEWDSDELVRWEMAEAGSMINELRGSYKLAESDGSTEVTYDLTFGIKIPMPGIIRRKAEKAISDAALDGLKTRAETIRGGT
jgi:ribosome-associated toxin RatA of RatAB toxin-antitoxin module